MAGAEFAPKPSASSIPSSPDALVNSGYANAVGDQVAKVSQDANDQRIEKIALTVPLVNGRQVAGGNYTLGSGHYTTDPTFSPSMVDPLTAAIQEMNANGIRPKITTGFRTPEEQDYYRKHPGANGAAKGLSWHQAGMAVDFGDQHVANPKVAEIMQKHGFAWGKSFHHPVHFQYAPAGTNPRQAMPW